MFRFILGDRMNLLPPTEADHTDSLGWVKVYSRQMVRGVIEWVIINTQEVNVSFLILKGHVQCWWGWGVGDWHEQVIDMNRWLTWTGGWHEQVVDMNRWLTWTGDWHEHPSWWWLLLCPIRSTENIVETILCSWLELYSIQKQLNILLDELVLNISIAEASHALLVRLKPWQFQVSTVHYYNQSLLLAN